MTVSDPAPASEVSRPDPKSALAGPASFWATASRESESTIRTTSVPDSTVRFARASASSTLATCSPGRISAVAIESSAPSTSSRQRVASSGRSSIRATIVTIDESDPAPFSASTLAKPRSKVVRPDLALAWTRTRWPRASGLRRSTPRSKMSASVEPDEGEERSTRRVGGTGVRSSNLPRSVSGATPFTVSTCTSAGCRSPRLGLRAGPATRSPETSSQRRIWEAEI